jgi:hypothetical protein
MRARESSDVLGTRLLSRMTLGNDGSAQAGAKVFGKFVQLGIAINLDGFLGGIADHVAVMAPGQMIFQFSFCARVNRTIKVVGQLIQKFCALHWLVSPISGFSLPFSRR